VTADPTRIRMTADPRTRRMSGVAIHGCIPFDVPFMTEIAPNLWQGGCEDGLVLPKAIRHLVSLCPWESYDVRHDLASSVSVRMLDGRGQDMGLIPELARWVNACRVSGPVLVHCQAGLNRSSLVVASALMLEGRTADEAIALIREKRSPACLCNPDFEEWLRSDGREECAACGRRVLLTASGHLRHHQPRPSARERCPGSSRLPADVREWAAVPEILGAAS
jgi:protein-tyrosine phosphatase